MDSNRQYFHFVLVNTGIQRELWNINTLFLFTHCRSHQYIYLTYRVYVADNVLLFADNTSKMHIHVVLHIEHELSAITLKSLIICMCDDAMPQAIYICSFEYLGEILAESAVGKRPS